jgi:hypothetical protein
MSEANPWYEICDKRALEGRKNDLFRPGLSYPFQNPGARKKRSPLATVWRRFAALGRYRKDRKDREEIFLCCLRGLGGSAVSDWLNKYNGTGEVGAT